MVEAMRHAFVDRNFGLGDPNFVKNPLDKFLSAKHAADIRAKIDPVKATPSSEVKPGVAPHQDAQTTHFWWWTRTATRYRSPIPSTASPPALARR